MLRPARASSGLVVALITVACRDPAGAADTGATGSTTAMDETGAATSDTTSPGATAPDTGTAPVEPLPPGTGCCAAHAGPGCDEAAVQACVCELAAPCCAFDWDDECVATALACAATCMADDGTATRTTSASETDDSASDAEGTDGSGDPTDGSLACCETAATPGCPDAVVEACVCGGDPFCCDAQWDHLCVARASESCGIDCGNECCTPHDAVACNDVDVFGCVAGAAGGCYDQWDAGCVQVATTQCGLRCG